MFASRISVGDLFKPRSDVQSHWEVPWKGDLFKPRSDVQSQWEVPWGKALFHVFKMLSGMRL